MKQLFVIIMVMICPLFLYAQEKEGIYKFIDYPISPITVETYNNRVFSHMDTFVRAVLMKDEEQYYYVLRVVSNDAQHLVEFTFVTMISYENLVKINKALKILLSEEEKDWKSGEAFVENKYVTDNGFKIGYIVENGRLEWFVESEYYGTINGLTLRDRVDEGKAFIINNGTILETTFGKAQAKIESLMQSE